VEKHVFGRTITVDEVNQLLTKISRVVVHPKYRSKGAGVKIVKETLPLCGKPYVETFAVMAQYNPFFEKAGMRKIMVTQPSLNILKAIEHIKRLGFSPVYLASQKMNYRKLSELSNEEVKKVRDTTRCLRASKTAHRGKESMV